MEVKKMSEDSYLFIFGTKPELGMKNHKSIVLLFVLTLALSGYQGKLFAQKLILMDSQNENKIINDSTITIYSSDPSIKDLTATFTIKNNTDVPLAVFLRKKINYISDSTTDFFCFYIKCWPDTDTTDLADTIQPGQEDHNFASHVVHKRRFDYPQPELPAGISSITYTVFDHTTFPEPVEASITVIYHLSPLKIADPVFKLTDVYPNPAQEYIRVKTDNLLQGNVKAVIFNSMGSVVKSEDVVVNNDLITIRTNDLIPGFYSGILTTGYKEIASFRFIVQSR